MGKSELDKMQLHYEEVPDTRREVDIRAIIVNAKLIWRSLRKHD